MRMFSGLKTHLEDAQKRKEQEQVDYVQKMVRLVDIKIIVLTQFRC